MTQPALKPVPPPARGKMTLAHAKIGKLDMPLKVLGYGVEGVGKSTFAAAAPKPVFISFDKRTAHLDIVRLEPSSFEEILECLEALEKEKHDRETVVVDPLTWAEPLVWTRVTGAGGNIDKYDGGYGRGHNAAVDQWRLVLAGLERLWTRGMHVVLLAHSTVKPFNDPESEGFDRYEIALNQKAAGLFKQWVDYVLFMRHEAFAQPNDKRKTKGFSTGVRLMHTCWTAAYDAKRSLPIPDELPISWGAFVDAIAQAKTSLEALKAEIARLIEAIGDAAVTKRATADVAAAGDDAGRLAVIANALAVRANESAEAKS
jgi:hypothetical protein